MTQQLASLSPQRLVPPVGIRTEGERRVLDATASRLITIAYEMALNRASWDDILDALAGAFPKSLVAAWAYDTAEKRTLALSSRGGGDQHVTPPASLVALLADAGAFDIVHSDKLHSRSNSRRAASEGDFAATTGTIIARNGGRMLSIEIRYADAREGEVKARAAALLRHIAPHLARAIELSRRERGRGAAELEDVVDALPFGIFFVDSGQQIHYANRRANEVRRTGQGPFTAFDGRLRAQDAETDTLLRDAISRAEHGPRTGSALSLSGPTGRRFYLTARLLQPRDRLLQLHDALYETGPRLLIAVHEADQPIPVPIDFLWRSFGLTDAEAKLAEALVNGWTLAELAHDRELSKQTLRNQLVGLMRKTGTKRQSQLVALLTRLSLGAL